MQQTDRQTDGWTDRTAISISRISMLTLDKMESSISVTSCVPSAMTCQSHVHTTHHKR